MTQQAERKNCRLKAKCTLLCMGFLFYFILFYFILFLFCFVLVVLDCLLQVGEESRPNESIILIRPFKLQFIFAYPVGRTENSNVSPTTDIHCLLAKTKNLTLVEIA